jgi:succinylarginine dihydrolase
MWTANAATVAPSVDTHDGKVHLTPANLRAKPHRAIEPENTFKSLCGIFHNESKFQVHKCLQLGDAFSDEGAANHTRFEDPETRKGLHFFVYGREALNPKAPMPKNFPARQTLEASQAVARVNQIKPELCYYAQQNPEVIDAGVFHNDVISVGHKNVLLYHEQAFINTEQVVSELNEKLSGKLVGVKVTTEEVSLSAAVKSYLFNSQIVSFSDGSMALIAPDQCQQEASVKAFIDRMIKDDSNPIYQVHYFDLLQSMKNGGGPACLRLRVQLTEEEIQSVNASCLINEDKYNELVSWVNKHYRDELSLKDLADYSFAQQVHEATQDLNEILNLK